MTKPKQNIHKEQRGPIAEYRKYVVAAGVVVVMALLLYLLLGTKITKLSGRKQLKEMNVFLITLDTLRVDYVSAYGQRKAQTPALDQVASEGVLFERCISQTPLTLPSHTSILSGTYPLYHQIRDNGGFLVPQNLLMVSELLQKQGINTAAFIAAYVLHSKWGINQGFDTYSDDFDLTKYEKISLGLVQKRADEVLQNAEKWLIQFQEQSKKSKTNKQHFFAWIHLYDPHTPYDPPSPYKERFPRNPYRGEVEYLDAQLGIFFQFLKQQGLYDTSLIILAADHGESLGEHGEQSHGFFIYEPTVHVPLIIRAPFSFPRSRVSHTVELIDLAPTILDALGIPIPTAYQGTSLLPLMWGEKTQKKNVAYTETYYPRLHFGWSELKALYYGDQEKFILAPKEELYDLTSDYHEQANLVLKRSYQSKQLKTQLQKFVREKSQNAVKPGETKTMDKEDLQKLAALGYLTSVVDTSDKQDLPDPKGKVEVFNKLSQARELMGQERYWEVVNLLESVLATEPNLVDGMLQLGNAYSKMERFQEALTVFYQVLEQKPDYNAAMINVLNMLVWLGRFDEGIAEAHRFLKTFPDDHAIYNELGTLYVLKEDYPKALTALNHSLAIEKVNPLALNKIANIYIITRDFGKARFYAQQAYQINNRLKKVNYYMAQIEEAAGNIPQAIEYYKKELEVSPEDHKSAYNLAEDLRKSGLYTEALPYYRKAIASNPDFNISYFMLAKYYLDRRENIQEAIDLCNQGIQIKPSDKYTAFGYYILADIYSLKGDQSLYRSNFSRAEAIKRDLMARKKWED